MKNDNYDNFFDDDNIQDDNDERTSYLMSALEAWCDAQELKQMRINETDESFFSDEEEFYRIEFSKVAYDSNRDESMALNIYSNDLIRAFRNKYKEEALATLELISEKGAVYYLKSRGLIDEDIETLELMGIPVKLLKKKRSQCNIVAEDDLQVAIMPTDEKSNRR